MSKASKSKDSKPYKLFKLYKDNVSKNIYYFYMLRSIDRHDFENVYGLMIFTDGVVRFRDDTSGLNSRNYTPVKMLNKIKAPLIKWIFENYELFFKRYN